MENRTFDLSIALACVWRGNVIGLEPRIASGHDMVRRADPSEEITVLIVYFRRER